MQILRGEDLVITYDEFSRTAPKHFVGLTLTAGEDVERGFRKARHEQELNDFQKAITAIFRKVQSRAKREGWKYKVYVSFSDEHLSRNTPEYNAGGEMGVDSYDRITNWHCHLVFYNDCSDMDELKHVANTVRWYWINGERKKTKGKDKGGYNIGGYKGSEPADVADLGWYYYSKCQAFAKSLRCETGSLKVDEWEKVLEREWGFLDNECREYLEKVRIPRLEANHDMAERVKAKNLILQVEGLKEFGRNLTQLPNFVPEADRHKPLSQLEAEGFDFDKAIGQCFSGVDLLDEYINPHYLYNRNLYSHMKKEGIAIADNVDFTAYDKEDALQEVRKVKNTKRELEQ
jgi:hypothetical protein